MGVKLALLVLAVIITQVRGYSPEYPRINRRTSEEKIFTFTSASSDGKGGKTSIVVGSFPAHLSILPLQMGQRVIRKPLKFMDDKASKRSYLRLRDGGGDPFVFLRRA